MPCQGAAERPYDPGSEPGRLTPYGWMMIPASHSLSSRIWSYL